MRGVLVASSLVFGTLAALSVAPAARADDEVKVHVDGDPRLVVERRITDSDLWESVCRGSCDALVPRDGSYRLTGRGIRASLPLALASDRKDQVHLDVKSRYDAGWYGSLLLAIIGPTVMVGGVFATIGGLNQNQNNEVPPCPFDVQCASGPPQSQAVLIAGVGSLITGALMTTAGILGLILTDHTTVHQLGAFALSSRSMTFRF